MIVFKKLANSIQELELELAQNDLEADRRNLNQQKLDALLQIDQFLRSFAWIKKTEYKSKVLLFIDNNYDYAYCADYLGLLKNTYETSMSWAGKKFESAIGKNVIGGILSATDPVEVVTHLFNFRLKTKKLSLSSFLIQDVFKNLPDSNKDLSLFVNECKDELEFLQSTTKASIKQQLSGLNHDKLSFLRSIYDGQDARYAAQRIYLFKYLVGAYDFSELLEVLNESLGEGYANG
jgi:hypothetical protein